MAEKDLSVITPMTDIVSEMEKTSEPESTKPEVPVWQVGKEETPEVDEKPEKGAKEGPKDEDDETPGKPTGEDEDDEESDGLQRIATKDDLKDPVLKARIKELEKGYQKALAKQSKKSEVRDSYWNAFEDPATRQDAYEKLGQQLGIKAQTEKPSAQAPKGVSDEEEEALYATETAAQTKARWKAEFKEEIRAEMRAELEQEYGDVVEYSRAQKQTNAQMARAKAATESLQAEFGPWLTTELIAEAFQKFSNLEDAEAIGAAYASRIRKHFANLSPRKPRVSMPKHEDAEVEGWTPGQPYSFSMAYQDVTREREATV